VARRVYKNKARKKVEVSKKESSPQSRVSRKELRRQQQEREKRMRAIRIWGPIAAVAIALVAFFIFRLSEPEVAGAVFVESAAAGQHDADFRYETSGLPPMGGIHNPTWQNCGIYTEPVAAEYVVHSMEHGAIWVTYSPDLPAEQLAELQDKMRGQNYIILSPYPDQASNIVLTAWDVQLQVDSAADERIDEFISRYRGTRGPERGATCSGGTGTPIS
jgi:hypothetical protein